MLKFILMMTEIRKVLESNEMTVQIALFQKCIIVFFLLNKLFYIFYSSPWATLYALENKFSWYHLTELFFQN